MTTIGSITSNGSASATSDSNALIGNYETFLTILTTQLQHQDPMQPMDATQFTEQLVQYSTVEQQIKTNDQLENLAVMMTANNALSALNFVDTTVTIDGSKGYLQDYGDLDFTFSASDAGTATMVIRNENGEIVFAESDFSLTEGQQTYEWTGSGPNGARLSKGTYSIQIIAEDASGNKITIDSDVTGEVTNVDVSGTEPMLTVNDQIIRMSQIKSIS